MVVVLYMVGEENGGDGSVENPSGLNKRERDGGGAVNGDEG